MKTPKNFSRMVNGIADYPREGPIDSVAFMRSVDVRTDPQSATLLPRTIKESASTIRALPKWGEYVPLTGLTYLYDEAGNLYSRDSTGLYTYLHSAGAAHGNGMSYFGEDGSLYYTSDKTIGRYGPLSTSTPTFVDDYFGSQGGIPLNTNALDLTGATIGPSRADTVSLSVTADLSLEAQVKPHSLPTTGGQMTIISKWTENGNLRSYKFGIGTVSNYFGSGTDGVLTISADTTDAPIDSACTGTHATYTLSATNVSFAADQEIFIHQSRGSGAGAWMRNKIQGYVAGTISLVDPLNTDYTSGAQVLVLKQYSSVTVNAGTVWSAKAWNGTTGGILGFLCNGTITISGTMSASNKGYNGVTANNVLNSYYGEGTAGPASNSLGSFSGGSANGNGGGWGGNKALSGSGASGGGGGGGNATAGQNGTNGPSHTGGMGGTASGTSDLTTLTFGGAGGTGGTDGSNACTTISGAGGGIIFGAGTTLTVTGSVISNGQGGTTNDPGNGAQVGGSGGGAGGSMLLKTQTGVLGTGLIQSLGGAGSVGRNGSGAGGAGASGRIHLDYANPYTGTTVPTLDASQDTSLSATDGYALFLSLSNNGTAYETYTKPAAIQINKWQDLAVSYNNTTKAVEFFLNAISQGVVTGTLASLNDNASAFNVGMDLDGSSIAQHLYDGLIDEVRVYSSPLTVTDYLYGLNQHINPAAMGLVAYYHFNGAQTDATTNANTLTLAGATYATDVPYASPTTRVDIDQTAATAGQTYTLGTSIVESSVTRKDFIPTKDPQKSIAVFIDTVGTGNWTLTVHDSNNNVIAAKTVLNGSLAPGLYEFIFDTPWSPLTNFTNTYHFHVTATVADGKVKTGTAADLSTVTFTTYFQFLVQDSAWHPIAKMLQFLVFGNGRYVGKLEATLYDPNAIVLPADWHVRCFGYWNEYLAIGCVKGTSITQQDEGRIFLWDGIARTYNLSIPVPEGGINALLGSRGQLFIWAGYQGDLLTYTGGSSCQKIKRLPKSTRSTELDIYPGAVTMWKGLIRFGATGSTTSTQINQGVYTYGKANTRYTDALTYDYPISTGTLTGTSLRIGMVLPVNQRLLIGWADGTGYGVDYVDDLNPCYPTGTIEYLIDDGDAVWKEKEANTIVAKFSTLASGQSVTLRCLKDDESVWTYAEVTTSDSIEPTINRLIPSDSRYHEIQYGVDLASTSGVSMTLKGLAFESDDLQSEHRL